MLLGFYRNQFLEIIASKNTIFSFASFLFEPVVDWTMNRKIRLNSLKIRNRDTSNHNCILRLDLSHITTLAMDGFPYSENTETAGKIINSCPRLVALAGIFDFQRLVLLDPHIFSQITHIPTLSFEEFVSVGKFF